MEDIEMVDTLDVSGAAVLQSTADMASINDMEATADTTGAVETLDLPQSPSVFDAPLVLEENSRSLDLDVAGASELAAYQPSESGDSADSSRSWMPVTSENPPATNIEVRIREFSESKWDEFEEVASTEVESIRAQRTDADGDFVFEVEFRNGIVKAVSYDELAQYHHGLSALEEWSLERPRESGQAKDLGAFSESDFDSEGEVDHLQMSSEEDAPPVRRSTRTTFSRQPSQAHVTDSSDDGPKSRELPRRTRSRGSRQVSRITSDEEPVSRRSSARASDRLLRKRTITSYLLPKPSDDVDELAQSQSSGEESDLLVVTSDLVDTSRKRKTPKRGRRPPGRPRGAVARLGSMGSDIEMENPVATRRSGRSTRNQKDMSESAFDKMLGQGDERERGSVAPKIASTKEAFRPVPDDSPFGEMHVEFCMTCRNGPHRTLSNGVSSGHLIFCQGCSFAYHKPCLGLRAVRDHIATKVGPDHFVLQCLYCVGAKAKDIRAARPDRCQDCKGVGKSCAPFSQKKTARAEETLRKENGGELPVTQVAPHLLDNADNVLFRCIACKRAWHFEHLPTNQTTSDLENARDARLKEYSGQWKCRECLTFTRKIDTLVAWRLAPSVLAARPQVKSYPLFQSESEDNKEYLVKWESRSYFHCTWMPGAWISGAAQSMMKTSFAKRASQNRDLYKPNEEEAISDDYLMADIILNVKYASNSSGKTFEDDLDRIDDVVKIYVKFVGLAYDQVVWDAPPSKESGKIYDAFRAAYIEYLNGKHFKSDSAFHIRNRVREFRESKTDDEIQLSDKPESLADDLTLMKYQLQGVNWLLKKYRRGQSGILADEMGLGKTLQVLAFISTLVFSEPRCWPFLVVVPNATCPNWRRETKRFAPRLRIVTYHGGKVPQDLAYRYELFPGGGKDMKAHVIVMSYDSAQDEKTWPLFRGINWAGLVVDEGQRLKNDKNLLYQALRSIKFPFKLLLTGTPVQNNKRELFNLLQFVDKEHDAAMLDEEYEELTDQKLRELHALISPYVLRRTKAQVLKFLPKCENIIVPVTMTSLQKRLYKSILEKSPDLLRAIFSQSKVNKKERGSLNNILMQLRKCLAHPFIYSASIEDEDADEQVLYRHMVDASAKLKLLEIMLPKLYRPTNPDEEPHRVLIFSQFLDQLDIVGEFLEGMGLKHLRLDGSLSSMEKQKRIDQFNQDNTYFAFLLSTRAGGVGINLATADTVIIMDPDFNPHQDLQAACRSHRIGQKRPVLVIQLMTRGSAEEKIMQIGKKKMALDHAVIERMDTAEEDEDLEGILRHGADALFGKDEPEMIRYTPASVDALLASRPPPKALKDGSAAVQDDDESEQAPQYSYGQVWSNDKGLGELGEPEDDNQISEDTWAAICALREAENARRLKEEQEILGRGGRKRQVVNYRTGTRVNGLEAGVLSDSDKDNDEEYRGQVDSDDNSEGSASVDSDGVPKPKAVSSKSRHGTSGVPAPTSSTEHGRKRASEAGSDQISKKARTTAAAPAAASAAVPTMMQPDKGPQLPGMNAFQLPTAHQFQAEKPGQSIPSPVPAQNPASSGTKSSACLLQELRDNATKWKLVEQLMPRLNRQTGAILRQLPQGKANAWWQYLSPAESSQFDKVYQHLMDMAKLYNVGLLISRRGRPSGSGTRSSAGAPGSANGGPALPSTGHYKAPAAVPTAASAAARPAVPRPAATPYKTALGSTKLSKTEIRVQLDKLKHSNLVPEAKAAERKRLKGLLHGVEANGA